jgi:DNA polymerase III epsilon subunit-like protein
MNMEDFLSHFQAPESSIQYNEEQLAFIHSPLESSILLGIPGGGKTQCIIGKIIHHFKRKEFQKTNHYLLLTFSRRACYDFIEKGTKQHKKYFNNRNVLTLHSLAGKIVFKILEKTSSSQDTVIVCASDLIAKHQSSLLDMKEFKDLKVIFVDEAQDISQIQYEFIMKLQKCFDIPIIMIGDPNQNIYQFQNGSDKYLIEHSKKIYTLIKNYRSSPEIVDFINQFRPWDLLTSKMISTKKRKKIYPKIFVGSIEEIIENIVQKIKDSSYSYENIAIIGPVKKSKPINDTYTNIGLSLMTNRLQDFGISYIKHYEDTNQEEVLLDKFKKQEGCINLLTIHGSKGLEFDQVFLLNFHFNTFGMTPNEEKYNEFKYLWYVGISRAAYDMNIYIDHQKNCWYPLKDCPKNYYILENIPFKVMPKLIFKEEIKPMYYTVTEILCSKKFFDDIHLFHFENIIPYGIEEESLFPGKIEIDSFDRPEIKNYSIYSALYGMYMENIFNFYYQVQRNKDVDFLVKLKKILLNTIIVPKNCLGGYKILKLKCPFIAKDLVTLSSFSKIKKTFKKREEELYQYLVEVLENDYEKEFFLDCYNDVSHYSKENLLHSIQLIEKEATKIFKKKIDIYSNPNEESLHYHIFQCTLFYYQQSNETAYLWKEFFQEELEDLQFYVNYVKEYVENIKEEYLFHPIIKHQKLPLVGELDLISHQKIVDIKMTRQCSNKHIMQLILYYHLCSPNIENQYELELWNFHNFTKTKIKLQKETFLNYELLKLLSIVLKQKLENMIFFYDLETTGLLNSGEEVDIIDRHFQEFTTNCVPSTGLVKPQKNKCLSFEITSLTGITDENLNRFGCSIYDFYEEMDSIFIYCENPIFVAHNGNSFDHKLLLQKQILKPNKCRLLDSRIILRLFLDKEIAQKSLSVIFEHLYGYVPVAHRAQNDVQMMILIFKKLKIKEDIIQQIFN